MITAIMLHLACRQTVTQCTGGRSALRLKPSRPFLTRSLVNVAVMLLRHRDAGNAFNVIHSLVSANV